MHTTAQPALEARPISNAGRATEGPRLGRMPALDADYRGEVDRALAVLANTGARVYIATAPYFAADGAPAEAAERVECPNCTNARLRRSPGAQILDVEGWGCPDGQRRRDDHGVVVREDGLHFSGGGAVIAADWALDHLAGSTS